MSCAHAVVWIDHRTARVILFSLERSEMVEITSSMGEGRLHRKSGIPGSGHAADDLDFFDQVATALQTASEVLIVGPGTAKKSFEAHLHHRHAEVARRIVGVETLDHPTDGELLAYARKFFKRLAQLGYA